ncbi:unnamed protein product [Brachionus calyciflorus]|uniref:Reverse transcriptase domain-containing protein n=1 Tax=Brachionus calyciflorus TaxID=104777 RepID=A0A814HS60_9BILA|nr:unnamed protein product [Brachionus calyciflorus]
MNQVLRNRTISLYIFIDFKKAFDTVHSRILLMKLKKYGFDENALKLIANYFQNRQQFVKLEANSSSLKPIKLGVPQGSILGPLLFLIFINDLVHYLTNYRVKIFADDTTLSLTNSGLPELLKELNNSVKNITEWCSFNRIDINWSK